MDKQYIIIDLKSFYASVECVERHLDPLKAKLVVADEERGRGTICLAVTPMMKKLGVKNRCRLFEIPKNVNYIVAPPRMKLYIDYSAKIYGIYLKYFAAEDIEVYSIDEAFMDVTPYLRLYKVTARELAIKIMADILCITGITATCGIGTNLYLAKIALDIMAKHSGDNIGMLDEEAYREKLWQHRPLTDFWRIGKGTAARLAKVGITSMEGIAKADEKLLYKIFGIDAQIIIDHAWGKEPTTIADIKAYVPKTHSLTNGQVLPRNYSFDEGAVILKEMADQLALDMVEKELVTPSVTLYIGYGYIDGALPTFRATATMPELTNSGKLITDELMKIYEATFERRFSVRRIVLNANNVVPESAKEQNLFAELTIDPCEKNRQRAINSIRKRFGKNAIFCAMDLLEEATLRERHNQIGGHKSGIT